MSFGLFEASVGSELEQQISRQASVDALTAAIYDVREQLGPVLFASRDLAEFRSKSAMMRQDGSVHRIVGAHLAPITGTVRRIVGNNGALEREFKALLATGAKAKTEWGDTEDLAGNDPGSWLKTHKPSKVKSETLARRRTAEDDDNDTSDSDDKADDGFGGKKAPPFGSKDSRRRQADDRGIENYDGAMGLGGASGAAPQDPTNGLLSGTVGASGSNPEMSQYKPTTSPLLPGQEGTTGQGYLARRRQSDFDGTQDIKSTFSPSEGELKPDGNFDAYLNSVDQNSDKVQDRNFTSSLEFQVYADWAQAHHANALSLDVLDRYAAQLSDGQYLRLARAIQAWEFEHKPSVGKGQSKKKLKDVTAAWPTGPHAEDENPPTQEDLDVAMDADWDKPHGTYREFDKYRDEHPRPHQGRRDPLKAYIFWCTANDLKRISARNVAHFAGNDTQLCIHLAQRMQAAIHVARQRQGNAHLAAPDHLQKANDALAQLLNQKAEEFQETIAPLQQAYLTVQQATQLQQQNNPMNVLPPPGTVNVLPGQAAPGQIGLPDPSGGQDPQAAAAAALAGGGGAPPPGGDPSGGGAPGGGGMPTAPPGAPPPAAGGAPPPDPSQQMQARRGGPGKGHGATRPRQAGVTDLWNRYQQSLGQSGNLGVGGDADYEDFASKYQVGPRALQKLKTQHGVQNLAQPQQPVLAAKQAYLGWCAFHGLKANSSKNYRWYEGRVSRRQRQLLAEAKQTDHVAEAVKGQWDQQNSHMGQLGYQWDKGLNHWTKPGAANVRNHWQHTGAGRHDDGTTNTPNPLWHATDELEYPNEVNSISKPMMGREPGAPAHPGGHRAEAGTHDYRHGDPDQIFAPQHGYEDWGHESGPSGPPYVRPQDTEDYEGHALPPHRHEAAGDWDGYNWDRYDQFQGLGDHPQRPDQKQVHQDQNYLDGPMGPLSQGRPNVRPDPASPDYKSHVEQVPNTENAVGTNSYDHYRKGSAGYDWQPHPSGGFRTPEGQFPQGMIQPGREGWPTEGKHVGYMLTGEKWHDSDPTNAYVGAFDSPEEAQGAVEHSMERHRTTRLGSRKQAWMGWGPAQFPKRQVVAGWDWDNHLNGYLATSPRQFECGCGEPFPAPSGFHRCACGKQWNSYVIGTGGSRHEASAEKFLVREIPTRENVIVANRQLEADGLHQRDPRGEHARPVHDVNDWIDEALPFGAPPGTPPQEGARGKYHADPFMITQPDHDHGDYKTMHYSPGPPPVAPGRHRALAVVDPKTGGLHTLIDPGELGEGEAAGTPTFKDQPADWAKRGDGAKWLKSPIG